jgi:hypothetical protein
MNLVKFALLPFSLLSLGACGEQVDDPQNIPELGQWRTQAKISGIEIGSGVLTYQESEELKKSFGDESEHTELGCTEPRVNSVEDLAEKLPKQFADMCTLSATSQDASSMAFESKCDRSKFPPEVKELDFSGETKVRSDRVEMRFRVKTTTVEQGGNTETLKFVQERTFWRSGSCSG